MDFEWDEDKARSNLKTHGISFEFATLVFDDLARIERPEDSQDYGEERWLVIGLIDGFEVTVVYTMRGTKLRLISARRATSNERTEYWDD